MTTQGYRLGPQKGISGGNPGVQMSLEDPRQTRGPQRWPGQGKVHRGTSKPLPPHRTRVFSDMTKGFQGHPLAVTGEFQT